MGAPRGRRKCKHEAELAEGAKELHSVDWLRRFHSLNLNDVIVVEIFAGSARLTSAVRDAGLQGIAVDFDKSRSNGPHIALFDLNDPSQFSALIAFLEKERHRIIWVHFAPSCGTASRARERPIKHLQKKGFRVPKPLRSNDYPLGLPGLRGQDKYRTETANITYERTAELCLLLDSWGIAISVENPLNSIFWLVPDIRNMVSQVGGFDTIFDHCCHGGLRDKSTLWWSNVDWFTPLAQRCDKQHAHAKWNPQLVDGKVVFPTHEEASYPILLCFRLASIVKDKAILMGATEVVTISDQLEKTHVSGQRFIINMLPRGKKFKPLVSEFGTYQRHAIGVNDEQVITSVLTALPKGSKVVHRRIKVGVFRDDADFSSVDGDEGIVYANNIDDIDRLQQGDLDIEQQCNIGQHCDGAACHSDKVVKVDALHVPRSSEHQRLEVVTIGVPREPMDFVGRAVAAGHPRTLAVHLTPGVEHMLYENFMWEPWRLVKKRTEFFWKWTKRAKELISMEDDFRLTMPPHMRVINKNKRLCLLKEILTELEYPDEALVDHIAGGFPISGWLPESHIFPLETKRPEYDLETIKKMAKGLNQSVWEQTKSKGLDEAASETWKATLEEIEHGWVFRDESSDFTGHLLARRFGLKQKTKTRVIDDCTVGGFNRTTGSREKLRLHAIDEMASYVSWVLTHIPNFDTSEWVGKTYDLTAAYKQFGISSKDRDLLRIVTMNLDTGQPMMLGANSMPFGATGSVSAFLRVSMAIWFVGVKALGLCWTAFFDDYTLLSRKELTGNTSATAEMLFDLIGIDFAKTGKKATDFSHVVKTLGLQLNLNDSNGNATLGHTADRKQELVDELDHILKTGSVETKAAERLKGRMQWFEGYVFGRTAQLGIRMLNDISLRASKVVKLKATELDILRKLLARVSLAPPIVISARTLTTWYIFTDGACEGSETKEGGIGGVLVSPSGTLAMFFSEEVPMHLMDTLCNDSLNPIYELELLPILVSFVLWQQYICNSQVVFFLDNDAARSGLIRAQGATVHGQCIVQRVVEIESDIDCKPWYGRVPTSSNIADEPSRHQCGNLVRLGCERLRITWEALDLQME